MLLRILLSLMVLLAIPRFVVADTPVKPQPFPSQAFPSQAFPQQASPQQPFAAPPLAIPTGQRPWVIDVADVLPAATRDRLEALLKEVEAKTSAEVMVFTIPSLHGVDIDTVATAMFNRIGIGKANTNNGILFLIAPNDRRTRIEVGYGLEPLVTDALAGEILDTQVVPRFKDNDLAGGIVAGTEEISRILMRYPDAARGIPGSTPWYVRTQRGDFDTTLWLAGGVSVLMFVTGWLTRRFRRYPATLMFVVGGLALLCVGLAFAAFVAMGSFDMLPVFPTSVAAVVLFAGTWMNRRQYRRYGPRKCAQCGGPMALLSEDEDDKHLSKTQQIEEHLGSVDYDVWQCPACMHHEVDSHTALSTSYGECPECHALTLREDVTTLVEATQQHGGRERVDALCLACNHRFTEERSTPTLSSSSSSDSGSGGSSGGGGGGSSGGGGASRSW